nr:MAG TPA: hypothetical protein [Caudoviricetes sp.]
MFKNIKSVEFYNILPYILQLTPQNIGTQVICQSHYPLSGSSCFGRNK